MEWENSIHLWILEDFQREWKAYYNKGSSWVGNPFMIKLWKWISQSLKRYTKEMNEMINRVYDQEFKSESGFILLQVEEHYRHPLKCTDD